MEMEMEMDCGSDIYRCNITTITVNDGAGFVIEETRGSVDAYIQCTVRVQCITVSR